MSNRERFGDRYADLDKHRQS